MTSGPIFALRSQKPVLRPVFLLTGCREQFLGQLGKKLNLTHCLLKRYLESENKKRDLWFYNNCFRSISYMEFAVDVWVAFAINKLFRYFKINSKLFKTARRRVLFFYFEKLIEWICRLDFAVESILFSLVLMIHGGRRRFTQECFAAKANAIPCCCLCCLPLVNNNM